MKLSKHLSNLTFFSAIPLIFVFLAGCAEDKSIQGFNEEEGFDPNDKGEIRSSVITQLELEEAIRDTAIATGQGPLLLLGDFGGIHSTILLKFASVPDSVNITNAGVALRTRALIGDDRNKSSFVATLHAVRENWEEGTVSVENFQNTFDATSLASAEILTNESGTDSASIETVRFQLNSEGVDLVKTWADSTNENFGFLVKFDAGQSFFVKEFFSKNEPPNVSQPGPTLELEILKDSELDTIPLLASEDAYLVETVQEPPSGPLYVDNVLNRHTILKFDLSEIPRESTINQANLILDLIGENSIITQDGFLFQIVRLDSPFVSPETFELATPVITLTQEVIPLISKSSTTITIPIRSFIQAWVNETRDNNGILIRSSTPGFDISRIALSSSTIDPATSARLEIDYTTSPAIP